MGSRKVITEEDILSAVRRGETSIVAASLSIVTPLARDAALARGIRIKTQSEADLGLTDDHPQQPRPQVVAIGSDHGGFEYKHELSHHIESLGWSVLDVGTHSNARCDYPDFAFAVARAVAIGKASFGVMIDGAGPGSAIVANKVFGIRAACGYSEFTSWNARAHNDCNVLTLGSRATGIEVCKRVVAVFLTTEFESGRHLARVEKIRDVEAHYSADRQSG